MEEHIPTTTGPETVSNKEAILVHRYRQQVTTHRKQIIQAI